ncbi:hypothetical protein E9529_13060 [Blastococcus sp. KM273128]|uniref:hypothetical protein n=1 Tax=Blastococcus sp. KM273128 TaxID=2570314 RepID=UPI001F412B18|nr:hypothetical protein [Blastococcus sp. KM273128]MCF6745186.1 hypothetical protein [Blastococcus sp. KM273128]
MTLTAAAPAETYRAPHWHDALWRSLPGRLGHPRARRWVTRLPMLLLGAVLAALSLRLRNGASADEALAVNAGRDLITQWVTGAPAAAHGDLLPGAPFLHPVLVAALDSLGGLFLVRAAGLACVLAAMGLLAGAVAARAGHRAGVFSAAAFALSAPVVLVGGLGTADAVALLGLATALWAIAARRGPASALAAGGLLALVPVVQYSTAVLVPVVLVAGAALAGAGGLRRSALAGGTAVLLTGAVHLLGAGPGARAWSDLLGAAPPSPQAWTTSAGWLLLDVGLLAALAVVAAVRLAGTGGRDAVLAAALLTGSAVFPAAQLWTGSAVAFDRHLAFSVLFLAPLAGLALTRMSRGVWRLGPVLLVLPVLVLFGVSRSGTVYAAWPDVRPVVAELLADPVPGSYLASGTAAEALAYHLGDQPGVRWADTYGLYARGEDAVRVAVEDLHYSTIVLHSASTGSPAEDALEDVVQTALHDNYTAYELVAAIPASGVADADVWLVYRQVAR